MHHTPSAPGSGPLFHQVTGEGPPVVLIQGVGVHHTGWQPQLPALEPHFRCLVFDNRGVGRSAPASGRFTIDDLAGDVLELMDGQGWESAHLVGHSMGGQIALRAAQLQPARVRSLGILCSFANGRSAGAVPRMISLGLRSRVGTRRMKRHAFLEILAPPASLAGVDRDALADRMATLLGHDLADHPPIEGLQMSAMRACDATPGLGSLAGIPTLVLGAEQDPISPPAVCRAVADGIPGARRVSLPDASHGVVVHQPERVNGLLFEHLRQAEAART